MFSSCQTWAQPARFHLGGSSSWLPWCPDGQLPSRSSVAPLQQQPMSVSTGVTSHLSTADIWGQMILCSEGCPETEDGALVSDPTGADSKTAPLLQTPVPLTAPTADRGSTAPSAQGHWQSSHAHVPACGSVVVSLAPVFLRKTQDVHLQKKKRQRYVSGRLDGDHPQLPGHIGPQSPVHHAVGAEPKSYLLLTQQ